ncbi:MAG: 30S ribosomal protein S7 [Dehalococcoidia bacterium]|nr:30S ribosomal protein S7 [Dehalococcoidia bacterium]
MPRRRRVVKRVPPPDAVYHSVMVSRITNKVMMCGKKSVAERIVCGALKIVEENIKENPTDVLEQAIKRVTPQVRVKARRIGGATYQVPVEVKSDKGLSLALCWLISSARSRGGRTMAERLANELMDAVKGQGAAVKKCDGVHRMAEANRAFAHYRW